MAVTAGTKYAYSVTAAAATAGEGTAPDRRRLYDFSDRVVELSPEESPFFVYLTRVNKVPTSDPVFRFLENRSKTDWTSRTFLIDGDVNLGSAVAAGTAYTFVVDDGATTPASVDWLVKGMVFHVNTVNSTAGVTGVPIRVNSEPVDSGSDTTFSGLVIDLPGTGVTGYSVISDNDVCQVIGTSYAEGSGAPEAWSSELEDDFGNCQIFKTSCELSNTARATVFRGYANEWARIWALKLREHKIDMRNVDIKPNYIGETLRAYA